MALTRVSRKTRFVLLCTFLLAAGCSSAGSPQQYQYTQMHYEADPDNEEDPEHILTAFQRCLSSDPVLDQWRAEPPQERAGANTDDAKQSVAISAEAMKEGSRVQALVDDCMAKSGYRTKGFLLVR